MKKYLYLPIIVVLALVFIITYHEIYFGRAIDFLPLDYSEKDKAEKRLTEDKLRNRYARLKRLKASKAAAEDSGDETTAEESGDEETAEESGDEETAEESGDEKEINNIKREIEKEEARIKSLKNSLVLLSKEKRIAILFVSYLITYIGAFYFRGFSKKLTIVYITLIIVTLSVYAFSYDDNSTGWTILSSAAAPLYGIDKIFSTSSTSDATIYKLDDHRTFPDIYVSTTQSVRGVSSASSDIKTKEISFKLYLFSNSSNSSGNTNYVNILDINGIEGLSNNWDCSDNPYGNFSSLIRYNYSTRKLEYPNDDLCHTSYETQTTRNKIDVLFDKWIDIRVKIQANSGSSRNYKITYIINDKKYETDVDLSNGVEVGLEDSWALLGDVNAKNLGNYTNVSVVSY